MSCCKQKFANLDKDFSVCFSLQKQQHIKRGRTGPPSPSSKVRRWRSTGATSSMSLPSDRTPASAPSLQHWHKQDCSFLFIHPRLMFVTKQGAKTFPSVPESQVLHARQTCPGLALKLEVKLVGALLEAGHHPPWPDAGRQLTIVDV